MREADTGEAATEGRAGSGCDMHRRRRVHRSGPEGAFVMLSHHGFCEKSSVSSRSCRRRCSELRDMSISTRRRCVKHLQTESDSYRARLTGDKLGYLAYWSAESTHLSYPTRCVCGERGSWSVCFQMLYSRQPCEGNNGHSLLCVLTDHGEYPSNSHHQWQKPPMADMRRDNTSFQLGWHALRLDRARLLHLLEPAPQPKP